MDNCVITHADKCGGDNCRAEMHWMCFHLKVLQIIWGVKSKDLSVRENFMEKKQETEKLLKHLRKN